MKVNLKMINTKEKEENILMIISTKLNMKVILKMEYIKEKYMIIVDI